MTQSYSLRHLMLLVFSCFYLSQMGIAQNSNDAKVVTNTYYIKNAFVVQKPGTILPNTSVLIRDGLIESVGPNISVPFDAQVIQADSMYVYAGFIDACSHAGIAPLDQKDRPRVKDPGNPPPDLAGITPQKSVRNAMGEKLDKSMGELRDLGFGFVHVAPRGRMLPGQGSVLSTGDGSLEKTLIRENVAQFVQFKSARGMFPGTTIGVMSKFRDMYKNAEYSNNYLKTYNTQPTGLARPNHSEQLAAFFPVVEKQMPVFLYSPKVKDINRAMILNDELGFNMVLTGVRQGWPLMDDIIAGGHDVVLSLHLPEKIEEEKKEESKKDEEGKEESKKEEVKKEEAKHGEEMKKDSEPEKKDEEKEEEKKKEEDPETKMLKEKKKKSHDEYVGQAALFEEKGITFSFSSLDTKSKEIKGNLMRMIAGGLTEDGALAALTTNPAELLGISGMAGTVEKGKIANIFVSDKPYFEKESKIKFLFNDGSLKEFKEKKKDKKGKKKGDGEKVDIAGTWTYTLEVPGDSQTGTIVVSEASGNYEIKISSADEPNDFIDGTDVDYEENNLTFNIEVEGIPYSLDVSFEGDEFEGTVSVAEFGSFPITGTKKDPE